MKLTVRRSTPRPARPAPSQRARRAAIELGVALEPLPAPHTPSPRTLTLDLNPDRPTAILAPSGAGKSTLLRDIARAAHARSIPTAHIDPTTPLPDRPAIDLLATDTHSAMRALAATGLADLATFTRRPAELSEGQRARLRLAIAIDQLARADTAPKTPRLLLADELAAPLDDDSAHTLALSLTRALRRARITLIAATHRPRLLRPLAIASVITLDHTATATITQHNPAPPRAYPVAIAAGTRADYDALAPFHYRAGPPATIDHILAARHPRTADLLAVLTISRPTLNSAARDLAWPRRYTSPDKRANARRINAELRCISRVIVAPNHRGLAIARRLVAAYLANPLTPATEAVAAMGAACPFFEHAGMTAYHAPPRPRDARLLDFLHHAGLRPTDLTTPTRALRRLLRATPRAHLEHELNQWAIGIRAARNEPLPTRFARACTVIATTPTAYAHTAA